MRLPVWLMPGFAVMVIAFGLYRIRLALKKVDPDVAAKRGGFYRMSSSTHLLVGAVYLLLGGAVIATSLGWRPFGGDTSQPAPAPDSAPTGSGSVQFTRITP